MSTHRAFNGFAVLSTVTSGIIALMTLAQIQGIGNNGSFVNFSDIAAAIGFACLGALYFLNLAIWSAMHRANDKKRQGRAIWAGLAGGITVLLTLPFFSAQFGARSSAKRDFWDTVTVMFKYIDGWMYPLVLWPLVAVIGMTLWWFVTPRSHQAD